MSVESIGVLFVCLGNICRSPLAEGWFLALVREAGVDPWYVVDSAGTGDYHVGELPDPRTREVARRAGIELTSRARQVTSEDLHRFDYLIAMDGSNLRYLERLARRSGGTAELRLLREFDPESPHDLDVPDPYYGGLSGFERVQEIIRRSCRGLLEYLEGMRTA